jgi:hypothetical protein
MNSALRRESTVDGLARVAEVLASAARLGYARSAAFDERRRKSAAMLKRPYRTMGHP